MGGRRRTRDHYARRAQREQYPARSIYKLEEIDRRVRLLKPGAVVLDLGAAPGSWTLYAAKQVTGSGKVVAVDRQPLSVGVPSNVTFIEHDALDIDPERLRQAAGSDHFDAVLSDMAPHTTGQRFVDQTRSYQLYSRALEIAAELCRPGGHFVGKLFQGEDFEAAREAVRSLFAKARVIRPSSVRSESYEIYLVGLGRH